MNRCVACGGTSIVQEHCTACGYRATRIDGFDAYAPQMSTSDEGFDAAHHQVLAGLEARNFWFRARNHLIVHALKRHAPGLHAFLEIGCGTGFVLSAISHAFPTADMVGSELHVEGLRHASERLPNAHFIQMDARAIPYASCFDAVGAFDVIEHIQEDGKVLRQAHGALVKNGILLLTVPQHMWLWSQQDEIAHHVRRYTRTELVGKVRASGFDIVYVTSFVTALLPAMLISRRRQRDVDGKRDPFHEFRLPGWLDTLLYAVMRLEIGLLKLGVSLPLGGSLLLVARKKSP